MNKPAPIRAVTSAPNEMTNDQLFTAWQVAAELAKQQRETEMRLRLEIIARAFKDAPIGTTHVGNLTCVKTLDYKIDNSSPEKIGEALSRIAMLTDRKVAGDLMKWEAKLSVSQYKALPIKAQQALVPILTIKEATPSLKLKETSK